MKTVAELVDFRRDLFFDGAVQISWFENDLAKRDKAATNFVFHGPDYHGVSTNDIEESKGYQLTDTASFSKKIIQNLAAESGSSNPVTLAIAGYGTGKSHLALTLSTLLSEPESAAAKAILANIERVDHGIGVELYSQFKENPAPVLVIPINGMNDFDLAGELSRQVISRLNLLNIDTTPIYELWPRFEQSSIFTQRNYDLRNEDFQEKFGNDCQANEILDKLANHDDIAIQWVNEIFEQANGYPIRAVGQESPQQLIKTLCDAYCGSGKHFQSMLILFDEFGRYLEFAARSPHIAGDAALQQIFEGVQDNSDKCSLLCLNQYELKVYLSRISRNKQSSIQRYITRYDSAKKYYLSSNLETLFAHLIEKKDKKFIASYLEDVANIRVFNDIQKWFPSAGQQNVWQDRDMFKQVIVQGCWPLHPLATLFLCRSSGLLQQRSALSFVADAFDEVSSKSISPGDTPWTIPATDLCDSPLLKELIATEEYGQGGAVAQSFETVTQRYQHDFSRTHRHVLLAVLIATKLGLKVDSEQESQQAICALSGLVAEKVNAIIKELSDEYGVLEWNERFLRYEIMGDAVPRSAFLTFLKQNIQGISAEQVEELFALHGKKWAGLCEIEPQFAADNNITTSEWVYQDICTNLTRLPQAVDDAFADWKKAVKPDEPRGQVLYCYVQGDELLDDVSRQVQKLLQDSIRKKQCNAKVPILVVLLHDTENKIQRILTEYSVLSEALPLEEKQKFSHFIEDHKSKSLEELKLCCEELITQREYIGVQDIFVEKKRMQKTGSSIFKQVYPDIIPFPFDGFATSRGNAARDCRLITAELLKGTLNHDWIATQEPQAQGRASKLMKVWGCMGDDEEVRLHPRHQGLGKIINQLENRLENEKIINAGTLINDLIAPPFGFNIASAGLVLGIFLASRSSVTGLLLVEQDISLANWVGKVFASKFLNLRILKATEIRYVSDSETGEWEKLLSHWLAESTYAEQKSFWEKAYQLRGRIPLPAGVLFERHSRLEEQAHNALKKLQDHDRFLEQQAIFYEQAYNKKDAGNLSRIAKDLYLRIQTMKQNSQLWLEEQIAEVEKAYSEARQAVMQFFPEWLSQQSCLSSKQIGSFRNRMIDQVGTNLKRIDLRIKFNQLEKHTIQIIASIEEREKIKFIIEDSRAFLNSHRVHPECRVAELRQWISSAKELKPSLVMAQTGTQLNVPEIQQTLSRVDEYIAGCRQQIKRHEQRFQALWELSIVSQENVQQARGEVGLLLLIFSGDQANIEDLTMMQKQLSTFEQDLSLWSDVTLSNEELEASIRKRISYEKENQDEDEFVWDVKETYTNILKAILQDRVEDSQQWFSRLSFSENDISILDAGKCRLALSQLENRPVYLDAEQNKKVETMRKAVKARLSELKLEGVLEMYNNLTTELKKQFMELVSDGK